MDSLPSLHHSADRRSGHIECTLEININDLIPVFILQSQKDIVTSDPRVVHEDRHPAEFLLYFPDGFPHPHGICDVASKPNVARSRKTRRLPARTLLVTRDDRDPSAALGKFRRDSQSNTA